MQKIYIVVGLGYGDEGKGLVTDYLCATSVAPIVIRFNGGQQAGHTVYHEDGRVHVFSNFGSGTLREVPTYWSEFCTFSPAYFLEEFRILNPNSQFYLDPYCPITTHYDVLYNRAIETMRGKNRLGSCGVGFGATIERSKNYDLKLLAKDLFNPNKINNKLKKIKSYYKEKFKYNTGLDFIVFDHNQEDYFFEKDIRNLKELLQINFFNILTLKELLKDKIRYKTLIFEGAQGILLDINFGNYPYVTQSNTTSKNALQLLNIKTNLYADPEIFYVTRCYSTRHGAGPFNKNSALQLKLINGHFETNSFNLYQQKFKIGLLNVERLNYALHCDNLFSKNLNKNLVITCLDQLPTETISIKSKAKTIELPYKQLSFLLDSQFTNNMFSFSPLSICLK